MFFVSFIYDCALVPGCLLLQKGSPNPKPLGREGSNMQLGFLRNPNMHLLSEADPRSRARTTGMMLKWKQGG